MRARAVALRLARWAAGLLLAAVGAACGPEPPQRIVLVTVDTLRTDAFETRMPRARAFAERGAVFERGYAASNVTQPTLASLWTGRHPWQHGVTRNGLVLADDWRTLAERLREAGFATAAVVGSFPLGARFGFGQGFDAFDAPFDRDLPGSGRIWHGEATAGRFYALADTVTDAALARLDASRAERLLLWVHYFDPHSPYGDRSEARIDQAAFLGRVREGGAGLDAWMARARSLYDADVEALDAALGRLFARLAADARRVETHVVFTADHGESFGEGGALAHGTNLTPEQVRVPVFIVSPRVAPGRRRDVVGSIDLSVTLLSLAGLPSADLHGRDLTRGPAPGRAVGMRRSFPRPVEAIRFAEDPLPITGDRFYAVVNGALYAGDASGVSRDDARDGGAPAEVDAALRPLFDAFAREARGAPAEAALDPEVEAALRALGYAEEAP